MSNIQPPEDRSEPQDGYGAEGAPRYPDAPPGDAGRLAGPLAQPDSIRNAVRLMWAGAAISLISLIITLASLGALKTQIRDQLAKSNTNVTPDMVNTAYTIGIVAGVVGAVIAIVLWLWMAWKNGQGRSWARIVATVLAVINVLSTLYTVLAGTATVASGILAVINLILAVVIVVLLWRKESSAFYQASSAPRYAA